MIQPAADARSTVDWYWEHLLELDPIAATLVGDERFGDRLPDLTERGRSRRAEIHRSALAKLATLDRRLDDIGLRTALDVMETIAVRELARLEHRWDRFQVVSHLWGPAHLLDELGSLQRADTPERLERYLLRLAAMTDFYAAVSEIARDGMRAGMTCPRIVVQRTIAQLERLLAAPLESSPALMPVPASAPDGREAVTRILRQSVMPALVGYLDTLREYVGRATETIGLYALPGGDAIYAAEVQAWTTLALDAREIHRSGVDDLAQIQDQRQACAVAMGFPDAAAVAAAATGGEIASKQALVEIAEDQVRRGWEAAPRYFGRLPKRSCEVRLVAELRERDMPFATYQPPSEDGSRPGVYYVNGHNLARRSRHQLATATYHEAIPGHHFQMSIEQEMERRPSLKRFAGKLTGAAFTEGWGLYSERLADEMGLYVGVERLGMLDAQATRAARLIVDTGIHAFGWDRSRAIAKLRETGLSDVDAAIETDRYMCRPGQALAYRIGQLEIERLRSESAAREGARFSLSAFHDRVLALGTLPLSALRRELGS